MPFKDTGRHLRDILDSIDLINEFVRGMDLSTYQRDEKTQAAVERKMQILTEAVVRLEMDDPEAFPEIDWKAYRGRAIFFGIPMTVCRTKSSGTPCKRIYLP